MLTILCGPARCGKSTRVYERMGAGCAEKRRQLLLTPEQRSHETERRLLQTLGNRAAEWAEVTTFTRVAQRVLAQCGKSADIVDAGGRVLLMHKAYANARAQLTYFTSPEPRPEQLTQFLHTIDELKTAAITPEQLLRACAGLSDKLRDLAYLYLAYDALCSAGGFDGKDRMAQACALLPECALFEGADLYLDGFLSFTRQEYDLIAALLGQTRSVTVTLLWGQDEQLYSEQYKTLSRLQALCDSAETVYLPHRETQQTAALRVIAHSLLDHTAPPADIPADGVGLFYAATPAQECELAAAMMRDLILQKGLRCREIAVAAGDAQEYAEKLQLACARYEVPLFVSTKRDILQKPAMLAALGGMGAVLDGLRPDGVQPFLKSGMTGLARGECEKLENYLYTWNVSGARWYEDFTLSPLGYGREGADDAAVLAELNALRAVVAYPLRALEESLAHAATAHELIECLTSHWQSIGLEGQLDDKIEELTRTGRRREASEYAQLYGILTEALAQFDRTLGQDAMQPRVFYALLRLMLSQYDVSVIPPSLDSVIFGEFGPLSLDGVRCLMVLGARDGLLPKTAGAGELLGEAERIALEGAGIELTQSSEERAFSEQSRICHAFAAPTEQLLLFVPAALDSGEECRASYLVWRVRRLLPGLKPREAGELLDTLSLTARIPAFEQACTAAGGGSGSRSALEWFAAEDETYFTRLREYAAAPRGPIHGAERVRALYGDSLRLTPTRAEALSGCRFSYFMQYGLRAQPRRKARMGAPEVGTLVHYVVEHAIRDLTDGKTTDPEEVTRRYVDRYLVEELGGTGNKSARFLRLLRALRRHVTAIVRDVWAEICASDFKPLSFELRFGGGELPEARVQTGTMEVALGGVIDRVDGYVKDNRLHLKVVDYKTGSKSFRLSDVLSGLNLQMFLYFIMLRSGAAEHMLRTAEQRLHARADELVPAAALYVPVKNPYTPSSPDESDEARVQAKVEDERRRLGLLVGEPEIICALEHPAPGGAFRFLPAALDENGGVKARDAVATAEQFGRVIRKTEDVLRQLAALVSGGDIEAQPIRTDRAHGVCDWCDFRAACHFDSTMKKDKERRIRALPAAEVHETLAGEYETAEDDSNAD